MPPFPALPLARRAAVAAALAAAVAASAPAAVRADAGPACPGADDLATTGSPRGVASATRCLLNAERAAAGLPTLAPQSTLERAASDYSATMVRGSFFAHRAPGGPTLAGRLTRAGYLGRRAIDWAVGENLAWARGAAATPRGIVVAWMASPGHRRNVMDADFREVGIGVVAGTPGAPGEGVTMTSDFGVRRLAPPRSHARRRARS